MSPNCRIPPSVDVEPPDVGAGFLFWMDRVGDSWDEVSAELTEAFVGSREAARGENSFIYIVSNDDLLGRNGAARAMASAGLVSGARTAALEGSRKGWTANVIAYDNTVAPQDIVARAISVLNDGLITGEVIHVGPGHIGKALV